MCTICLGNIIISFVGYNLTTKKNRKQENVDKRERKKQIVEYLFRRETLRIVLSSLTFKDVYRVKLS
jgi:hypothetical protein